MAIRTVYYRNKTGMYGTLNTDDYIFNNFPNGAGMASFSKDIYPYVKIDNEYFLNDGEPWDWNEGQNSAKLMKLDNAFKWTKNNITKNVLDGVDFLKQSITNINNDNAIDLYSNTNNSPYVTVTRLGKYGAGGHHIRFLTHSSFAKWDDNSGYLFSKNQNYGKVSGTNIFLWATPQVASRQTIFESFTNSRQDVWKYSITYEDGVKILTYDNKKYIIGEKAKLRLYKRTAVSKENIIRPLTQTVTLNNGNTTDRMANYLPNKDEDNGQSIIAPYWMTYWSVLDSFEVCFGWDYFIKTWASKAIAGEYFDFICECSGNKIYYTNLSTGVGSYQLSPTVDYSATTEASCVIYKNITSPIGVLVDNYDNILESATWSGPSANDDSHNVNAKMICHELNNASNNWKPRCSITIKNFCQLDFLPEVSLFKEGGIESSANNIWVGDSGSPRTNFIQELTLLRKFSILPGVVDLKGWNLFSSSDDCDEWNRRRHSWTDIYQYDGTISAMAYMGREEYTPVVGFHRYSYLFTSVGLEREGNYNNYAYCLTIEYDNDSSEDSSESSSSGASSGSGGGGGGGNMIEKA